MTDNLMRDFKGVWIPKDLWLDDNLTKMEMLALVEIDSLSKLNEGCIASNKHFAEFLRVSKDRVKQIMSSLVQKGYIMSEIERDEDTKQIIKRRLFCTLPYGIKLPYPRVQNYPTPRVENYPDNNTVNSNTKEYILYSAEAQKPRTVSIEIVKEIINYLNLKAGTNYKHTSQKTQSQINARFNEGFNVDDFKKVIDKKVSTWGSDVKMAKYLRPVTLFGTKFESYLNEKIQLAPNNNIVKPKAFNHEEHDREIERQRKMAMEIRRRNDEQYNL